VVPTFAKEAKVGQPILEWRKPKNKGGPAPRALDPTTSGGPVSAISRRISAAELSIGCLIWNRI
jgi:hypothetical protein